MKSFANLTPTGTGRHPWMQCVMPAAMAFLICGATAQAQTVYRCGSSYSDTPCPQGQTVLVDDARSEEQRQDALHAAERTRALANTLEATRQQEEEKQQAQALAADQAAKAERRRQEHLARKEERAAREAARQAAMRRRQANRHPHDDALETPWFEAVVVPPAPRKRASTGQPERKLPPPAPGASAPLAH